MGRGSWRLGAGLLGCGHAVSFLAPSTPPASARADEFAALENMLPDFPCALLSYSPTRFTTTFAVIQRPLPAVPALFLS